MKKTIILLTLAAIFVLVACGSNSVNNAIESYDLSEYRKQGSGLLFSNLATVRSQNTVRNVLLNAGADRAAVDDVFAWVNIFNALADDDGLLYGTFTQTDSNYVVYDMEVEWQENDVLDYDVNCHAVAFHLLRSFITVDNPVIEDISNAGSGAMMPLQIHSNVEWSQEERNGFISVFDLLFGITESEEETADAIIMAWAERGVTFGESKLSLVSVWSGSWVIHSAVLVELDEGLLLFEKTNPLMPFQASIFNNAAEVREYMVDQMYSYGLSDAMIVVMRNDVML